ncbi:cuticle protein-like [Toxorhynchites rutilus septentrionalis]|uniref:cuticle protein-like n=1 Tax=Toxorhynchites rutilus septentrionalis TaxID=329112 RepID=UPI00247A9843|nr:cuticle protein-like [Toxorhynchites rutilus septentrionalis]
MAFKFVTFLALVAVARAGLISSSALSPIAGQLIAAPLTKTIVADQYDPNPQYSYSYGVSDALTGDQKSQQESRNGDVVQGSYSLVEPDGTKRIVEYTADPIHGFNAIVHRQPLAVKTVAAAPVLAAKTIVAQPALSYAAPLAQKTIISQPALSYSAPLATKTILSQPALSYAAPLAQRTIISQPSILSRPALSYGAPLVTKTILSQPAIASPLATQSILSQPALPYGAQTILSQQSIGQLAAPALYH